MSTESGLMQSQLSPAVPLRHGHAISIDMAYSATLANQRGLLSDEEHRRLLNLFSRAGLSMDHELFDEDMLDKATKAILKTRDGLLRAAVPNPIGQCVFLNDVSAEEMNDALRRHKELMKEYPRQGAGLDAYVDSSDTGYTINDKPVEEAMHESKGVMNGLSNGHVNGKAHGQVNGLPNGLQAVMANGYPNGYKN
jgi:3-dehydroquinate synthase